MTKEIILKMVNELEDLRKRDQTQWLHLDKKQADATLSWMRSVAETVGEMERTLKKLEEISK